MNECIALVVVLLLCTQCFQSSVYMSNLVSFFLSARVCRCSSGIMFVQFSTLSPVELLPCRLQLHRHQAGVLLLPFPGDHGVSHYDTTGHGDAAAKGAISAKGLTSASGEWNGYIYLFTQAYIRELCERRPLWISQK